MAPSKIDIVDMRSSSDNASADGDDVRLEVLEGLSQPYSRKYLPMRLLYDERGLQLYDEMTTNEDGEYYPFPAEERILQAHAGEIASIMNTGANGNVAQSAEIVELGAGSLRKTSHILRAFAQLVSKPAVVTPFTYYALDLDKSELQRTLSELSDSDTGRALAGRVAMKGLWGTYENGIELLRADSLPPSDGSAVAPNRSQQPMHFLFIGSSLGNFPRGEDAAFLRSLPLRSDTGDKLLLGLDHCLDKKRIEPAYHDRKGMAERFARNGLLVAGRTLGDEGLFDSDKFDFYNRYDEGTREHRVFFRSKTDQVIIEPHSHRQFSIAAGELINIGLSTKYSEDDAARLFADAYLRPIKSFTDSETGFALWVLERSSNS